MVIAPLAAMTTSAVIVTAEPSIRSADPESSTGFVSMAPTRVLDTRAGSGPVVPGSSVTVELAGVPGDAAAAVVNVTATGATGDGFVSVWDCDGPAPGTSNGNYVGIGTVAANVITATNTDAEICVTTGDAPADVLVDLMGYYPAGSGVVTIAPRRSLDTRASSGGSGPVQPGSHVTATLEAIPADAAAAIVNITATNATADGFFVVWDCDGPAPETSNGNYVGVSTIANSAIVPIGDQSQICVQTGDGAADILVDTVGYLTADSGYTAVSPARLLDTRNTDTPLTPGDTATITLSDVPVGDTAIVNVTATNAQGDGYFTVWNCDGPAPDTSNGNYVGVTTIANTAIITPNADQQICMQTGDAAAHIIIDTTGHTGTAAPDPSPTTTTTTPTTTSTTLPPAPVSNWPAQVEATGNADGRAVAALADGSAIITGSFAGEANFGGKATFGDTELTSSGINDVFVARINADGSWRWAAGSNGAGNTQSLGVSTLGDGSAIVTGFFTQTVNFGDTISLTSDGAADLFVAKIDAGGDWVWATQAGGTGDAVGSAQAVSALSDGSAIITGLFGETVNFGDTISLTSGGAADLFVAKITAGGDWVWATRAGGTGDAVGSGISVLTDGSGAIVTGRFTGTATFPTTGGGLSLTSAGSSDVFIAKIDADGDWVWATQAGGTGLTEGFGISVLTDGSAAIATGTFNGRATFGDVDLTSAGDNHVFVARVTATGAFD